MLALGGTSATAQSPAAIAPVPVDARVERDRDRFVVTASMDVPVPPAVAWAVLTDYPHMSRYLPNLIESRVTADGPDGLHLLQRGRLTLGPFSQLWETERVVVLTPETSIGSHLLRGNMKRLDMITQLAPTTIGTRVDYRADMQPDFWVPPLIGPALMRRQVVEQFEALAVEMQRRHAAGSAPGR